MEHNEIKEAIFEAFKAVNEREELKAFIMSELFKAVNDDRWITIHPHGEDSDDYRRLKIKDGETVEEAMHRQGYYNKRKAKDEKKAKEAKTYTEENYDDFHKLYYKDNEQKWQFKKEKGNNYLVTRTDEKGNWIHYSHTFERLDEYLNENNLIKATLPKTKVKGKDEYKEDEKTLNKFLEKGFKITAKYDDGYEIKYILEKEDNRPNTSAKTQIGQQKPSQQKSEIENLLKTEENKRSNFLQLYKDYKKAENKYNRTRSTTDMNNYLKAGASLQKAKDEYKASIEKSIDYVKANSTPLAKNGDIAGVKIGKPMTFDKANKNNANPEYVNNPSDEKFNTNCQSCVLAYEARRRGYDVKAIARDKYNKTALLAKDSATSLIDNQTGKPCEYQKIKSTNSSNLYNTLDKTIKENERYFFVYSWFANGDSGRHVVTIEKDENKNLAIYDPQTGKRKYKDEMKKYFSSYLKFNGKSEIGILRVDDKEFNNFFVNDGVLEKS